MKLYLEVSRDKYELPAKIADTAGELAEMCGVTKNTVASSCSHYKTGITKRAKYILVEVEDDEIPSD